MTRGRHLMLEAAAILRSLSETDEDVKIDQCPFDSEVSSVSCGKWFIGIIRGEIWVMSLDRFHEEIRRRLLPEHRLH